MKQKDSCRFNKHVTGITNEPIQFLPLKMNIYKEQSLPFLLFEYFQILSLEKEIGKNT